MGTRSRVLFLTGLSLVVALIAGPTRAQDYPNREITLVIPFPAGGATDAAARVFAEHFSAVIGQRVIIENRAGANGATATRAVAKATPDGYTLTFNGSNMPINLHGMKDPGYKWEDFVVIGGVGYSPMVLVANTASGKGKTLKELVAYAKANPGKLNYATFGPQSVANLSAHRFATIAGITWHEVPYKGAPQIVQDLIGGNVDVYFGLTTVASQVVKQPNVGGLGFSDKKRSAQLPDVPTFSESGYPEMDDFTLVGIWAPAGLPKPILDKLRKAVEDTKKSEKLGPQLEKTGTLIYDGNHEKFDQEVRKASDRYGADFKRLGIQPE